MTHALHHLQSAWDAEAAPTTEAPADDGRMHTFDWLLIAYMASLPVVAFALRNWGLS